jgi:hypothetical protein
MPVDAEVVRVREAIAKVHQIFIGITQGLQNITFEVDKKLDSFSSQVHGNYIKSAIFKT